MTEPSNLAEPCPLAVAIVNHDRWDAVVGQLQSWHEHDPQRFGGVEWVVVHNGDRGEAQWPDWLPAAVRAVPIRVVANRGYGSALNEAVRATTAPVVLGCNADLVPPPGLLAALLRSVPRWSGHRPAPAVVGVPLVNADGSPQGSAGRLPTLPRILLGRLRRRAMRKYDAAATPPSGGLAAAPWVTGACVLLDRAALEQVGGFDEGFFMYYEDVDLCRRVAAAGWGVYLADLPAVRHLHPYHDGPPTPTRLRFTRHGLLRYFRKHRPRWEFRVLLALVRLTAGAGLRPMLRGFAADPDGYRLAGTDREPEAPARGRASGRG